MQWQNINTNHDAQEPFAGARFDHAVIPPPNFARAETRPDVIIQLEKLDDVIFAAIEGDQCALQESRHAWSKAVQELGAETVEETRRQYLRHAQSVWESLRKQPIQPANRIFAAIEIIGLLVNSEH